jgi:hypothetical protein
MADYPTSIYIRTGHTKESILETLFVYLLRSLPYVNRIALRRQKYFASKSTKLYSELESFRELGVSNILLSFW